MHGMMHRGLQNGVLNVSKVTMMLLMIFQSSLKGKRRKEMPTKQNQSRRKLPESIFDMQIWSVDDKSKGLYIILDKVHGHLL